jgi:protein arginine kinase
MSFTERKRMLNQKNLIFTKGKKQIKKHSGSNRDQIVLTTRARIARNLSGYKLSGINSDAEKKEILNTVRSSFFTDKKSAGFDFYSVRKLSKIQRNFLVEKHILSPEMTFRLASKGLILKFNVENFNQSLSLLLNEEDHLRIQNVMPGLNIRKAYQEVLGIEKMLEKHLKFAYDRDFGYITSCPSNLGTAVRISVMVHIPSIIISGKIEEFIKKLNNIGCSIRGFFGENSEIVGNILQIANQASLGRYEQQIIDDMEAVCLNIIDEEKEALQAIKKNIPLIVEDSVLRSYGMLKHAKILSYYEAIELLSMLSMGIDLGLTGDDIRPFNFYDLISILGDSSIILNENMDLEPESDEIDKIRMDILRRELTADHGKNKGS